MDRDKFIGVIGDKIKAVRKSRDIPQEKLAELSGLHTTYVSNIENGKVNPSIYSCYVIANALGIPVSELVNLPGDRIDKGIENGIAELLSAIRHLSKRKQVIFLSAAKGLIAGIEEAKESPQKTK